MRTGVAVAVLVLMFVAIDADCAQEASGPPRELDRVFTILQPPVSARIHCCRIFRLDEFGYVAVGSAQYLDGRSRGWVALLDSRGGRIWERQWSFGSPFSGLVGGVNAGKGLSYLVGHSGDGGRDGGTRSSAVVIKVDARGDTVWTRVLPFAADAQAEAVTIARNGTVIVSGWTRTHGTGKSLFVVALDPSGAVLWERILPQTDDIYGVRIYVTQSGDYLLGGSFGLLRLNATGAPLWQRPVGDVAAFLETRNGSVMTIASASGVVMFTELGPRGETSMERILEGTCFIVGAWTSVSGDIIIAERRCSEARRHWVSTFSRSGARQSSSRLDIPDNAVPLEVGPDRHTGVVGAGMFNQDGPDAPKGWFLRDSGVAVTK